MERNFALDKADRFTLQTKPHGHGDVHTLLHTSGLLPKLRANGCTHLVFFQDTNVLAFKAIPAALGASIRRKLDMNSLTVPRSPGEAAGAICKLVRAGEPPLVINVEYNQLDALLQASGKGGFVGRIKAVKAGAELRALLARVGELPAGWAAALPRYTAADKADGAGAETAGGAAAAAASEYLEQWAVRKEPNATWKFSKSRQTFLLKGWPHSHRVSRDSFKHLLNYLQTLPEGTATKTIEQAKQVATSAEKDELALEARVAARKELAADADAADEEDDEDNETGGGGGAAQDGGIAALEEQRAMLKIQRARALRVLNALVAAKSSQEFEQ
jgi:hypothetical protein